MTDTQAMLNPSETLDFVNRTWDEEIVPKLVEYIRIPNKSPMFDPDWNEHGFMEQAVELISTWCEARPIQGLSVEVVRIKNGNRPRTPVIYMEIPAFNCESDETVLLYGHLDKQPEMVGWRADLGPWKPKIEGDKLYGRGGADDGYAAFGSLTAIEALQRQGVPHARCVVLIEACEESGSFDLPFYVDHLAERIGSPSLVVCLDSGCGNYEQLWGTTSLRGIVCGDLKVEVLREGVHSGDASGIVPSSFRILRQLLSRIEDPETGRVRDEFHVRIPKQRVEQARAAADVLGDAVSGKFPWLEGMRPMHSERAELVLNRTWRPTISITGVDGMPPLASAGNVLRPQTTVKVSMRVPPTMNASEASAKLKALLEADPPYGAKVSFHEEPAGSGWEAPAMSPWLLESLEAASNDYFGKPAVFMGEGGSIPFMGMLGAKFPKAQFLITGLLGPGSNAHGPNEFLHVPTGKRLTACVARVVADHRRTGRS